jgi:hypothetical protein
MSKVPMQEILGDIRYYFDKDDYQAICCTINTIVGADGLVMGAGVALAFKEKYSWLPATWGSLITRWDKPKTYVLATPTTPHSHGQYAVGFPTKRDWRMPSELKLIERSAKQLRVLIEAMGWKHVLLPRPGCQNGGLRWIQVREILLPILDDRVTIISKD